MITFPNAKINIGLNVIAKRTDGFHDIESCFYPIQWSDILEITPSEHEEFNCSGLPISVNVDDNLVWKAYKLLKSEHNLPAVHIHLHKVIPMGAGIGGGSSDAAFTLKILNSLFNLKLTVENLLDYAGQLGSDCAFFIKNRPALASGRGTELVPVSMSLTGKNIILINPQIHISTAEAYTGIIPGPSEVNYSDVLSKPVNVWRQLLRNDFEYYAFKKYPEIQEIVSGLYEAGASYASMTGSGSTVYGIFENDLPVIENRENYITWSGKL